MDTIRDAAIQLRDLYGGKGKMKLKLFISVKGIKLYHFQTLVSTSRYCIPLTYSEFINDHFKMFYWSLRFSVLGTFCYS